MATSILLLISGLFDISLYEKFNRIKSIIVRKYSNIKESKRIRNAIVTNDVMENIDNIDSEYVDSISTILLVQLKFT